MSTTSKKHGPRAYYVTAVDEKGVYYISRHSSSDAADGEAHKANVRQHCPEDKPRYKAMHKDEYDAARAAFEAAKASAS